MPILMKTQPESKIELNLHYVSMIHDDELKLKRKTNPKNQNGILLFNRQPVAQ
jgi:hypothetical protein